MKQVNEYLDIYFFYGNTIMKTQIKKAKFLTKEIIFEFAIARQTEFK